MKIRIGTEICEKNYEVSIWIIYVGVLVRAKGFPGVRVGLGSAFPSVRLDLESLAFVICFMRIGKWRRRINVDI